MMCIHFAVLGFIAFAAAHTTYNFQPDTAREYLDPTVPVLYDPSTSQVNASGNVQSYWTASFVTASDQHQYVLVAHVYYVKGVPATIARASIFDATTESYYKMFLFDEASQGAASYPGGILHAESSRVGIEGVSKDSISVMRTWSKSREVAFNLTFETTSRLLLNGGLGEFNFGGEPGSEWAIPAGQTSGTVTVNGTALDVDPAQSFTWYDRQWGGGSFVGNYTWFLLHLPEVGISGSIWALDDQSLGVNTRWATFRFADGSHVIRPYTLQPSSQNQFFSNATGHTYPTQYKLLFDGGDSLEIRVVGVHQLIYNSSSIGTPGTEAFSEIKYNLFGLHGVGYGITEQAWLTLA